MLTAEQQINNFVRDGNQFLGPMPTFRGKFKLSWVGSGSALKVHERDIFENVDIRFSDAGEITIGRNSSCRGKMEIKDGSGIYIGENTNLNRSCDLNAIEGAAIEIGSGCLLSNVAIRTSDYHSIIDTKSGKRTNPAQGVFIEDDVWIGENVVIYKGVRIGTGSIVAGGSLVTRSIPPLCVAAGRPATPKRSGVHWTRKLVKMDPLAAPEFSPDDIPLEKGVYQYLAAKSKFKLIRASLEIHAARLGGEEKLPVYAQWYLAKSRFQLKAVGAKDVIMLQNVLSKSPGHSGATEILKALNHRS